MSRMIGYSKMPEPAYSEYDCKECKDKQDGCQACCPHDERDHGICLDCGDEQEDYGSSEADALVDAAKDAEMGL